MRQHQRLIQLLCHELDFPIENLYGGSQMRRGARCRQLVAAVLREVTCMSLCEIAYAMGNPTPMRHTTTLYQVQTAARRMRLDVDFRNDYDRLMETAEVYMDAWDAGRVGRCESALAG